MLFNACRIISINIYVQRNTNQTWRPVSPHPATTRFYTCISSRLLLCLFYQRLLAFVYKCRGPGLGCVCVSSMDEKYYIQTHETSIDWYRHAGKVHPATLQQMRDSREIPVANQSVCLIVQEVNISLC